MNKILADKKEKLVSQIVSDIEANPCDYQEFVDETVRTELRRWSLKRLNQFINNDN